MFLRSKRRVKDGKEHRYWSVVENRRVRSGRVVQRQVLFLGEINDRQQGAWRQTLEVFDEAEQRAAAAANINTATCIAAIIGDGTWNWIGSMFIRICLCVV